MAQIQDSINGTPASASTATARRRKPAGSGGVPVMDIIFKTLHRWPWIVLSVAVCVTSAYFYLLRIPIVETRSAEILIKSDKGKTGGVEDFADFGLYTGGVDVNNEIMSLKSTDLMEEVVRRLRLNVNYFQDGRFRDPVLYGWNLPLTVSLPHLGDDASASFKVSVADGNRVTVSNLVYDGKQYEKSYTGRFNDSINTPMGRIAVMPTTNYVSGDDAEVLVQRVPVSAATGSWAGRLNVATSNEKGTVLRLTVADESAQRADDVLTNVIAVYNENWVRDKNQIAVSTSNFINERLGVIEQELGGVENEISSYKSANMMTDVQSMTSTAMNISQESANAIQDINTQLSLIRYVRQYVTGDTYRDQMMPAPAGLGVANVQGLISEYNAIMQKRNELIAKSSDKNPLVAQLDSQLAALRQVMVRTIDNNVMALNSQLKTLQHNEAKALSRVAASPAMAKHLLGIERQQKVKESLYLFLLQKREENELNQAFTAYNTRIVNKPGSAGVAPTPDRRSFMMFAFLLGLAIPFAYSFATESLNSKLRGRKDIEDLPTPFLGEIPLCGSSKPKKGQQESKAAKVYVKEGKRDVVNEAFRVLRTNLEFMRMHNNDGEADVIALTSFNPGSGKSFLIINLATALALKGRRVLVIDGDMRHATTSHHVGLPEDGLANYLNGSVEDPESVIVQDPNVPNLYVLPVGSIPPNPTELLESRRFGEMMARLRTEFDYILIDCPPVEVVADAQIIDRLADRTVFVLRAGVLERSMLPQLERLFDEKKYSNMAVILNGTHHNHRGRGYGYAYRYGYGYGYSNSYYYDKQK